VLADESAGTFTPDHQVFADGQVREQLRLLMDDGNPVAILRGRLLALVLLAAYSWAFQFSNVAGLVTVATLCAAGPWLFMRAQRFSLANTSYQGQYIFGGSQTAAAPFSISNATLGGNLDDLLSTPIRPVSGTTVYLRDIATIENGTEVAIYGRRCSCSISCLR
jgi:multidrug efflux pump subunit AcrB